MSDSSQRQQQSTVGRRSSNGSRMKSSTSNLVIPDSRNTHNKGSEVFEEELEGFHLASNSKPSSEPPSSDLILAAVNEAFQAMNKDKVMPIENNLEVESLA